MESYDFCLAWNAEEDSDFVNLVASQCKKKNLKFLEITSENFETIQQKLINGELEFKSFFDRGSDTDARFMFLIQWVKQHQIHEINKNELISLAIDKATMHNTLIAHGLQTPYSILLPSYRDQPDLPQLDLRPLGDTFIIKPAHGGGGEGVIREAKLWDQVAEARKEDPEDMFLLQVFIRPRVLDGRQAWFRAIYCTGQILLSWWDTQTHVYEPVSKKDLDKYNLHELRTISETIAGVCKLELFSSEVALTDENLFIVVDYVNDQLDLRLKSKAYDGIPDELVKKIADLLTSQVATWVS